MTSELLGGDALTENAQSKQSSHSAHTYPPIARKATSLSFLGGTKDYWQCICKPLGNHLSFDLKP